MKTPLLIAISLTMAGTVVAHPNTAHTGLLAELHFHRGSAELPMTARERTQSKLARIAAWALENPDALVVLDGHADRAGRHPENVRLSLARAHAVRDRLLASGVNPEQIVIAAFGGAGPQNRVVVWGTRAGMDAVVSRTLRRGHAVIRNAGTQARFDRV
jgi:outer membrane protein OmpA-like peptidoglycan-associated protein